MARIERLELFKVPPRWLFLKVVTDEGVEGWGEPVVEGRADTVAAAVREVSEYVVGADPTKIEDMWQVLYRGGFYRGGPVLMSAISGIEQAMWDISGKMFGLPVHRMLGGAVREKMRVYSWIGGDRPSEVVEAARGKMDAGMNAVKMNGTAEMAWIDNFSKIEEVLSRVQALRDAFGHSLDIAVDFHGRVRTPMARVLMKELETYHLMFIEEPVLVENREAFIELRRHTSTPIATGERNFGRWDFKDLITCGAVDILQPDLSHAGGIWEVRKIAAMAEAYDIAVAPHCPLGPIDSPRSLSATRLLHPERLHPGAEPRHPLQSGDRSAGLPEGSVGLPLRERFRRAPGRTGAGRRGPRGDRPRKSANRTRLAQPGLEKRRRQRNGVVSAIPHRRTTSVTRASYNGALDSSV